MLTRTPRSNCSADWRLQFVIAYPISRGKMINFVAFTMRHDLENTAYDGPWMVPADVSSFAGAFQHWEPEVQMLIKVSDEFVHFRQSCNLNNTCSAWIGHFSGLFIPSDP